MATWPKWTKGSVQQLWTPLGQTGKFSLSNLQTGRVSPRNSSRGGNNGNGDSQSKKSPSPIHSSPLHKELASENSASQTVAAKGDTDETDRLNPSQLGNHVSNDASESNLVQRQTMAMHLQASPHFRVV
ncbi:hypothetical protein J3459_008000 [Metarhizium acridum]|nr:hypothetical protein J3459_008000 [Metarhizium acridum]